MGFLCCFSIREFGAVDSLDAFHNIVRANVLADAEEWPTDLTNVGLVPKLTKDLHGSPSHTKWVWHAPGAAPDYAHENPNWKRVRLQVSDSFRDQVVPEPSVDDLSPRVANLTLRPSQSTPSGLVQSNDLTLALVPQQVDQGTTGNTPVLRPRSASARIPSSSSSGSSSSEASSGREYSPRRDTSPAPAPASARPPVRNPVPSGGRGNRVTFADVVRAQQLPASNLPATERLPGFSAPVLPAAPLTDSTNRIRMLNTDQGWDETRAATLSARDITNPVAAAGTGINDVVHRRVDAIVAALITDAAKLGQVVGWYNREMPVADIPYELIDLTLPAHALMKDKLGPWLKLCSPATAPTQVNLPSPAVVENNSRPAAASATDATPVTPAATVNTAPAAVTPPAIAVAQPAAAAPTVAAAAPEPAISSDNAAAPVTANHAATFAAAPHAAAQPAAPSDNAHANGTVNLDVPSMNDPTFRVNPVAIHAVHDNPPPSPADAKIGGSVKPDGRLKIPNPPFFKGDSSQSNPRAVRHWLRCMDLTLRQCRPSDPVLMAVNFMEGNAAAWRDVEFLPSYSVTEIISWESFEKALLDRFVSQVSCVQALADFKGLKQLANQSVQEYNFQFRQRREELKNLPHISIPDLTSQIDQYVQRLHPSIRKALPQKLTPDQFTDLNHLMKLAENADAIDKRMALIMGYSSVHTDIPIEKILQTDKSKSNKWTAVSQKRPRSSGSGKTSDVQSFTPSKGKAGRSGKAAKHTGSQPVSTTADQLVPLTDQHPNADIPGSPVYTGNALSSLRQRSKLNVQGTDGKMYPNLSYRLYAKRDCVLNKKCFGCFNLYGHHARYQCPNPNVSPSDMPDAHMPDPHELSAAALPPPPPRGPSAPAQHDVLAATVQAIPYKGITMLFAGAVRQQEKVNVLLDTGSSHSFCRPGLVQSTHTGRKFSVTMADNSVLQDIPEGNLKFKVQGIACNLNACEMQLPDGVDIILGQSWMKPHQATLLTWCGQVNFIDDQGLPACWQKRSSLSDNPYNSNLMWTSAAACTNSSKQYYIMFVRTANNHVRELNCAINAAVSDNGTVPPDIVADTPGSAAAHTDVFVEHQSAVHSIKELVAQFSSVFSEPAGLPPDRGITHAIPMQPNHAVPANKTYRLSKPQREEMESQVKAMLAKGWIRPSTSPFGSPILFVKKKTGGMRMCVDYRAVNKLTIKNSYPLPRIDDLLDKLTGAKMFSCLDLQQAYHQIRLHPDDIPKTAFTTPMGLFEYLVLPFGLSNAPSTFQSLINSILGPDLSHCCLVYLDDIVVFSKSPEEHLQHLRLVLTKLQNANLYARLSKCRFALKAVKFLGHVVDEHGIMPDPDKIKIVLDWPVPTTTTDARAFVGLAQYFRKFIQGFANMTAPLTALFKKDAEFLWSSACQRSFQMVKDALTSVPCLKLPDMDEPFTVVTDASGVGVGGVLMQAGRPVAFEGRKLTPAEKNWSATEQEMLAVVHHLEKWRCYLEGVQFTVITDHQPNTWFAKQKQLSPRLTRWYEKLRGFEFQWEYKPGRLNVADPLSRNPTFCNMIMASAQPESSKLTSFMNLRSAGSPASIPALPTDNRKRRHWDMRGVLDQARSMRWKGKSAASPPAAHKRLPPGVRLTPKSGRPSLPNAASSHKTGHLPKPGLIEPDTAPTHTGTHRSDNIRPSFSLSDQPDQVPDEAGLVQGADMPLGMDTSLQGELTNVDADINSMAPSHEPYTATGGHSGDAPMQMPLTDPSDMLEKIKQGYLTDPLYTSKGESKRSLLGITTQGGLHRRSGAIAVPDAFELRRCIMRELHCSPYCGHTGIHRTQSLISRYFYWPNMHEDITEYVKGCIVCQRNKSVSGVPAGKLQPLPVPSDIWKDVSMDFIGPMPMTARHHDYVLVVVDRLSKMAHFLPCKTNISGQNVAQLYAERIWSLHGLPRSIVTDRGRPFLNAFNTALTKLLGTQHAVSSAYHPETDGQTERVNRILCEMLRHYTNSRYDDWDLQLPFVEFAHNNARSSATGMSPFYVCYGRHPDTPMTAVIESANATWEADPHDNKHFLTADKFIADKQAIVRTAQAAMESARQRMARQESSKRKALTFQPGDQVSLKTKHLGISTLPSKKLFQPWMGPFTVAKVVNPAAYMLELPRHWKAHNVFHVSLLKPYLDNGEAVDPQSFTLVGGKEQEFELESIYNYGPKTTHKNGKPRKVSELVYWVKWRGLPKGMQARQTYKDVKGNADDAFKHLAAHFHHPADLFLKGSNKVPPVTPDNMQHA